ncbi:MAG: GNAT family N-acetyltransferase [Verrucomicrobiales bacterium]
MRAVLERNGFAVEAEMPLMICSNEELAPIADPDGIEFVVATEMKDVVAALEVQCEAFGDPPPDDTTIQRQFRMANQDLVLLLARDKSIGEPAGAGMTVPPIDGVTEVAGIAVKATFRKRGIAATLSYRLSRLALDRGVQTLFLSPASDEGERVYGRVGFHSVSGILHMALPVVHSE